MSHRGPWPLPPGTMLLVEVGSTSHGTGLPGGEDLDQTCVVVESETTVLGLGEGMRTKMQRTQPEGSRSGPGDVDRTLYPLRRFLRLAAGGNPSMLASLWSPVEFENLYGYELRGIADAFVGRHVIPRYLGYMRSQGLRLLGLKGSGHGVRGGGRRDELIAAHGYDTKYAMHCARLGIQCEELLTTGRLDLPMAGPAGDWLRDVRAGKVPFDDWWDKCLEVDDRVGRFANDESIRPGPDVARIERYSVWAHTDLWDQQRKEAP